MSLRQQANILGIAPSYLSMMINGKRPWKPEIKARYDQLVNSTQKSVHKTAITDSLNSNKDDGIQSRVGSMVELRRLELLTPYLQSRCSPS